MTTHRSLHIASLAVFLLAGCGDATEVDAGTGMDAGTTDAGATDAGTTDAGTTDAGTTDAGTTDAGTTDAGTTDAGTTDAGTTDAGTDAGACAYLDLDLWISDCGSGHAYVRRWTDTGSAGCPDYYTVGSARYATLADALSMNGCDPDCLRAAAMSVTLLRCGVRTGYITYRDPEMDCDELLETPDGLYGSVAEWNTAHPCP